ncbi:hypothetical protein GOP47_0024944 [Adiantum capillus-veneris]|uniref:Uncharacterized protein n=1 Tax=Adiantum capillus-veneris TaxID=13818 RepID=A0A9D4U4Y4_ADICA|nr:hypothetical protein GOP47_0024944 [Adiantum capillus-veneris]
MAHPVIWPPLQALSRSPPLQPTSQGGPLAALLRPSPCPSSRPCHLHTAALLYSRHPSCPVALAIPMQPPAPPLITLPCNTFLYGAPSPPAASLFPASSHNCSPPFGNSHTYGRPPSSLAAPPGYCLCSHANTTQALGLAVQGGRPPLANSDLAIGRLPFCKN